MNAGQQAGAGALGTIRRSHLPQILAYSALLVLLVVSLYPFLMMFVDSFKNDTEILVSPWALPKEWTLANYKAIFSEQHGLWINFLNGMFIAVSSTVISVLITAMAAFAFAKYHFAGRNVLFAILMLTLMVPPQITIPPLYLIFAKIGWLDTLRVQVAPTITSVFGLFLIRQFMAGIPEEILEAARVDGAGNWTIFWKIMLPVSAPILGAFAILHFLGVWNSYLWPLLVASRPSIQPIMVTLPNLTDPNVGFLPVWGTIMAGCTLATLPNSLGLRALPQYLH